MDLVTVSRTSALPRLPRRTADPSLRLKPVERVPDRLVRLQARPLMAENVALGEPLPQSPVPDLLRQHGRVADHVVGKQRVAAARMTLEELTPRRCAPRAHRRDIVADKTGIAVGVAIRLMISAINEVKNQRQRAEQPVVLRQVLLDERIGLLGNANVAQFGQPLDEDFLRIEAELKPGKLVVTALDRAPLLRVEIPKRPEDSESTIVRLRQGPR